MAAEQSKPKGPDLSQGVSIDDVPDGAVVGGVVGDEPVLLTRSGNEFSAIGATCSHYGGPLAEGLIVDARRLLDRGTSICDSRFVPRIGLRRILH